VSTLQIGDQAPHFQLPGVDGHNGSLEEFAGRPLLVVIFSCNHCPYVQAYEDRMISIQRDYRAHGVQLVAINSNDDANYPQDSFDAMVQRAKDKAFNFPYLRDANQAVAKAYGATHTPQLFVFDHGRKLRYTGKIDDNWQNPAAVKKPYLREALDALLKGAAPAEAETHAIGCTIKWAG